MSGWPDARRCIHERVLRLFFLAAWRPAMRSLFEVGLLSRLFVLAAATSVLALGCGNSGKGGPGGEAKVGGSSAGGISAGGNATTSGGLGVTEGANGGTLSSGGVGGVDAHAGGTTSPPRDPFDVVLEGVAADIYVDAADHAAVVRAVGDLQADVKRVSGASPTIKNTLAGLSS